MGSAKQWHNTYDGKAFRRGSLMPCSSIKLFLAFGLRMSMALNLFSQQGREDILGSLGWLNDLVYHIHVFRKANHAKRK